MPSKSTLSKPRTDRKTIAKRTTTEVAIAAARDHGLNKIIKAAELIRARPAKGKTLGLAASKALNLMIGVAGKEGFADKIYTIPKKDLRRTHKGNERIDDWLVELQTTLFYIDVRSPRGKPAILRGTFLDFTIEEHDDGHDDALVYFKLTEAFRKVHARSNLWAALSGPTVIRFDSVYALRLYEIGCQMVGRADPTMHLTVPELRELLQVPAGNYDDWANLRRKTLDAAVSEINQHAHFEVVVPENRIRRAGRKVMSLELQFWTKPAEGAFGVSREGKTHNARRKARPEGTGEQVADARVWRQVLEKLRAANTGLEGEPLENWIKAMRLERINGDTAIIAVEGWAEVFIRDRFGMLLADLFGTVTKGTVAMVDIVSPAKP